jgi:flagellar hook-length control protein FliK
MNLSSYLQMPPAPLTPNSTSSATPQGPRTGVGTSAGGSLGFDFAQVMARQMERLVPQERQTFAADVPEQPEAPVHTQDSRPVDSRSTDRAERDARSDQDKSDEDKDTRNTAARQRNKGVAHKPQRPEVDALLEGLMQGAPVSPISPSVTSLAGAPVVVAAPITNTTETATPSESLTQATLMNQSAALQSIQLSPQTRLITDPQKAPNPESLAAFAKSMGLDEAAIQNLLAQQPGGAAAMPSQSQMSSPLQAAMNHALGTGSPTAATGDDMVALQLAAMNATVAQSSAQPAAASGAGLAAAATTLVAPALPGLTPTDMAAIQQLQITVMPAAVLPVNTNTSQAVPSTLDMLSLMGTGIDEQDVEALLTRFTEESGAESNPEQQSSSDEGQQFSSFAQSLARNTQAANTNAAAPTQAAANMSEVYDQLSDKMATEMAARMHKQLSDGEWKMKFALRPSNLGGVEIQLEMKDGKLDAVFHADNPLTRDLLQNSSQRLREALGNFGINAGQVNVGQGGGNPTQNGSGNSGKQSQVRDNSSSQVNGDGSAISATSGRNKANASLLDLYA